MPPLPHWSKRGYLCSLTLILQNMLNQHYWLMVVGFCCTVHLFIIALTLKSQFVRVLREPVLVPDQEQVNREAAKKVLLLVVRPLRGKGLGRARPLREGGKGGQSGTRLDTDMEDNSWAAKIIRPPGGTSLTELGPAPTVDGGEHNVNEDATAPTPGQPCELTDDEMPNGNIPQLDGEDTTDLEDIIDLSKHAYNAMINLRFRNSYKVHTMKIYELKGLKSCEGEVKGLDHKCNICAQNKPIFKPIPGTEMNFYVTDMHDGLQYRVVDHINGIVSYSS